MRLGVIADGDPDFEEFLRRLGWTTLEEALREVAYADMRRRASLRRVRAHVGSYLLGVHPRNA